MIVESRQYQLDAIAAAADAMRDNVRRLLLVLPTGGGKTIVFSEIVRRMRAKGKKALILAHARELVFQASNKLNDIGVKHGVIMAGERATVSDVQVASLHTLKTKALPPADLVVVDEADLARAKTYGTILDHYKDAFVLGVTASPWRSDGKGLGELFQKSIVAATPRQLIDLGYLVRPRARCFVVPDMDHVGVNKETGDYNERQLARFAESAAGAKIIGDAVGMYLLHARGRRAVAFTSSIVASKMTVEKFCAAGVPAEHIDADTDKDSRRKMFERVAEGKTLLISSVGVVTRGVDVPSLEVAILLHRTKSLSRFLQMCGRTSRTSRATGKVDALILDHARCIFDGDDPVHDMPDIDRDYSLDADTTGKKTTAPASWRCMSCYFINFPEAVSCVGCGHARPKKERHAHADYKGPIRTVTDEEIRALTAARGPDPVPDYKQAFLNDATITARRMGHSTARGKFHQRFKLWPNKLQLERAARAADAALAELAEVER